jgi:hypothetical protein
MRRLLSLCALLLLTVPVSAAGWTAGMEEDEGGPVMTASVTGEGPGDFPPMLRMNCGDEVGLRYLMSGDSGGPNDADDFLFSTESDEIKLHMQYEEMDGAFAAYFPTSDPVIDLLEAGADLLVTNPAGVYPPQSFTLEGSSDAIETLLKSCE